MSRRRNVFISHHHADDGHVDRLTGMLKSSGYEIRNSSIRAKPANRRRLDKGLVKDATIRRLLRMKMSWASTVVVLIGAKTHCREWVDWEIRKAMALGKRIVGVYVRGGTEADIPQALEDHGTSIVNWNARSIIDAIEGGTSFEKPGGGPREPVHVGASVRC